MYSNMSPKNDKIMCTADISTQFCFLKNNNNKCILF